MYMSRPNIDIGISRYALKNDPTTAEPVLVPGGGTVTQLTAIAHDGVTAIVANSSTTPVMVIELEHITPLSVQSLGTITGSNLSGNNTGDQTNISGNASTATKLANARTINGVLFDGTTNITVTATDQVARDSANSAETPAGSALKVANHVSAVDPHGDRSFATQRGNHTGTQPISTITGLSTALADKADTLAVATALASKADSSSLGNLAVRSATVSTSAATGTPATGAIWFQYTP